MLTYVITLPVVSRENLGGFKLIVISRALGNEEFLYIEKKDSILCLDQVWLYCLLVEEEKLCHCKTTTT